MNPEIISRLDKIRNGIVPDGYKKTNIWIIPEEWEVKRIKDIAPLQRGFDLPNYNLEKGNYPVCYSNGILNYHNECMVKGPGVFTGRSGTIGKVFFIRDNYWPHNTSLWVTDFKGNHPKFIYFFYCFIRLERFMAGTGVPTLNRNDVHISQRAVPENKTEQSRIAAILSTWDKAIELKEKLVEQKKMQKKGLMQMLLTGKKRVINPETGKQFEGELLQKKVGDYLGEISIRNKDRKNNNILSVTNDRGFIKQSDQFERIVASKNTGNYKIIKKGQFAYNPARVNVGSIDLLSNFDSGILSPMYVVFETKSEQLDTNYFFQFIKSDLFVNLLIKFLEGSVRKSLSFSALGRIKLFIPEIEEQKIIASILSKFDIEIELLENELEQLKEQKRGLMQLLLTGIVRVNDLIPDPSPNSGEGRQSNIKLGDKSFLDRKNLGR